MDHPKDKLKIGSRIYRIASLKPHQPEPEFLVLPAGSYVINAGNWVKSWILSLEEHFDQHQLISPGDDSCKLANHHEHVEVDLSTMWGDGECSTEEEPDQEGSPPWPPSHDSTERAHLEVCSHVHWSNHWAQEGACDVTREAGAMIDKRENWEVVCHIPRAPSIWMKATEMCK